MVVQVYWRVFAWSTTINLPLISSPTCVWVCVLPCSCHSVLLDVVFLISLQCIFKSHCSFLTPVSFHLYCDRHWLNMEWLFGRKKTPQEMLRQNQRALNKAMRDLDRERQRMEQQEKKVIADIKKMAKQGQQVCQFCFHLDRTQNQWIKFNKCQVGWKNLNRDGWVVCRASVSITFQFCLFLGAHLILTASKTWKLGHLGILICLM